MSIVAMSKLRLVGISYEKEKILNVLHKTGIVELKKTEELDNTDVCFDSEESERINLKLEKLNKAIDIITEHLNANKKTDRYPKDEVAVKNYFDCSYDEFIVASGNEYEVFYTVDKVFSYADRIAQSQAEKSRLKGLIKQLEPYYEMTEKFSAFKGTLNTDVYFGIFPKNNLPKLREFLSQKEYTELSVLSESEKGAVISILTLKDEGEEVLKFLNETGFERSYFDYDCLASEKINSLQLDIEAEDKKLDVLDEKICRRTAYLRNMKIYADFLRFQLEKIKAAGEFRNTQKTFVLEGYLPTEEAVNVTNTLLGNFEALLVETTEIPRDEFAPTLTKNNKVFKTAEFITNMYSPPRYGEIDPNPTVFIFFMLFLGFIMADIGYGIIMILMGVITSFVVKRNTGFKKIMKIVGWGGVFTVMWGILFNSILGYSLPFYNSILPSVFVGGGINKENTMIVLLFSLLIGICHITFGYIMKAANCFKRKKILDGIFDGLMWIPFFVGLVMFCAKFLFDFFNIPITNVKVNNFVTAIKMPGIYMTLAAFGVIAIASVRNGKGFGRVVKPFGAAYGLINLLSDILSYARLFGLMLSGIVFAIQFDKLGGQIMAGGGVGYVFGPLVIIIGHTFNLAMGVLGAYIHDSRLQYIEYFGKFYDGEGELFVPFASEYKYINLTK